MSGARYDGHADEYDAFADDHGAYYAVAGEALRRLLGRGPGTCLDLGCGTGRYLPTLLELGWAPTGADESADQLRVAGDRRLGVELVRTDAASLPFADESFAAAVSLFTHTDFDDFAGAVREVQRVLAPGGSFVYVGNHPCFVGPVQEHVETGLPRLHPGYRLAGRCDATNAIGATPGGWRARLGSFVHLPLGSFLAAFAGFKLVAVEELDDGWEYPKALALALRKP